MNPFLHHTVASPTPTPASVPTASRSSGAGRFARLASQFALAAGMVFGVAGPALAVDVNAASQSELESVRGVGPKTAELILQERQKGGAFKSFDDFSGRVRGIGTKRAQKLRDAGLTVGPAVATTAAATAAAKPLSHTAAANPRNTPRTPGGKAD